MKYADVRPQIKSGDVLAWTHRGLKSWYDFKVQMVRIFTKSEYTHVGIAWVYGDRVFVLESVTGGIRIQPLSDEIPFFWVPIANYWNDHVQTKAFEPMGQRYSNWEGIRSVFFKITPGKNKKWQCSEYVNYVLQHGGFKTDAHSTPSDIMYWLQHNIEAPIFTVTE